MTEITYRIKFRKMQNNLPVGDWEWMAEVYTNPIRALEDLDEINSDQDRTSYLYDFKFEYKAAKVTTITITEDIA